MHSRNPLQEWRSFLVLNVDALHLTIALCQYDAGQCHVIDHVTHVSDSPLLHEQTSVFTTAFRDAFQNAQIQLKTKTGEELPQDIIFVWNRQDFLAFPFSYTFPRSIPGQPITYEELERYVEHAQKKAYENAKNRWSQTFFQDPRHMHLLSSSIHALEIDKRVVLHPIGYVGENVRLSFLYVFCPQAFFDTVFRFFEKQGFLLQAMVPRPIAFLNSFYTPDDFFGDYLILDFGYHTTSIIAHHGWRLQDFATVPVGAYLYEEMLKSHEPRKKTIEHRSILKQTSKHSGAPMDEYASLLLNALHMMFPKIEARVSTRSVHIGGHYGYDHILNLMWKWAMSPFIHPDSNFEAFHNNSWITCDVAPVQSLFSGSSLFSVYRDPLVNIFRSHLVGHES